MDVYIETVLLDNFVIDYIILFAVSKTLHLKIKKKFLAFASLFGAVFALLLPLINLHEVLLFTLKMCCGVLMIFIIIRKPLKKFLLSFFLFVIYTFVTGGAIIGIILFFNGNIYSAATLNYNFKVPVWAIAVGAMFIVLSTLKLVKFIDKKRHVFPFKRRVEISLGKNNCECEAFIDTGNGVFDSEGQGVNIISFNLAQKLIGEEKLNNVIIGLENNLVYEKKACFVAGGKKSIFFLIKIDSLKIYLDNTIHTIESVPIGISLTEFKGIDDCQILLHPQYI